MKNKNRLNKRELARRIAEHGDMTIDVAESCINSLIEVFRDTMASDGEIVLQNMGSFSVSHLGKRMGYNPITGENIVIDARRRVKFTPSSTLQLGGILGTDYTDYTAETEHTKPL